MGEAHLPARKRERDLAVVHVPGEDEVEATRLEVVEDARVVAEEDREVGLPGEAVRVEASPAAHDQPRIGARDPHAPAPKLEQPPVVAEQRAPARARAGRTGAPDGSRLSAMSWLPSTANTGRGSSRTSRRSIGSPRGWVRRSPLIATRSGFRSRAHSAACQTAPTPGDGTPRWKSDRCAIRSPSSSGGSPGSSSSSSRSRTQPASSRPQPRPAAAAQPRRLRLRAARAPAAGRRCGA